MNNMKTFYDFIQLVEMDNVTDPDEVELQTSLQNFMQKLNMVMQKNDLSREKAKNFLQRVVSDMIKNYGLKSGDVRQAMTGAISQGNEVKTPPQQPQAV